MPGVTARRLRALCAAFKDCSFETPTLTLEEVYYLVKGIDQSATLSDATSLFLYLDADGGGLPVPNDVEVPSLLVLASILNQLILPTLIALCHVHYQT